MPNTAPNLNSAPEKHAISPGLVALLIRPPPPLPPPPSLSRHTEDTKSLSHRTQIHLSGFFLQSLSGVGDNFVFLPLVGTFALLRFSLEFAHDFAGVP